MIAGTTEIRNENTTRSVAWLATAIGASAGIAALAYSRRRPTSRWDRVSDRATHLMDTAREEVKPWMGVAAGSVAAGTALAAYLKNRGQQSRWERASQRAGDIAVRVGKQALPWADLATVAAVGLGSIAYAKRAQRRNIRGIGENTADTINALAEKGLQLLRRVRSISEQTGKLYPRVRRMMA